MKVIQRNFRTFMRLRNWNWFSIVQKTRPLIGNIICLFVCLFHQISLMSSSLQGMINIEEEIKLLENAAENAVKEGEKEAVEKKRLDAENKRYVTSNR